jgi:hypothetical protein
MTDAGGPGPLLLIVAVALGALFVFSLFRRLFKTAIVVMLIGAVVVGLYIAREQGLITW